jgi:hypothetical protein
MPPRSTRRRPAPRAVHTPTPSANYAQLVAAFNAQQGRTPAVVPTGTGQTVTAPSATGLTPEQQSQLDRIQGAAFGSIPAVNAAGTAIGGATSFLVSLPAYLKITAGGLIVGVSGLALVYVAGRNTPPVQAAKTAAKVATPVGRVASTAAGATKTGVRVSEARGVKRRAKANVRTRERQEARSEAEDRLRITRGRSGRERVKLTSSRQAASDKAATSRARSQIRRSRLKALKAA